MGAGEKSGGTDATDGSDNGGSNFTFGCAQESKAFWDCYNRERHGKKLNGDGEGKGKTSWEIYSNLASGIANKSTAYVARLWGGNGDDGGSS